MHRVLAVPELLDTVFKALDAHSNLNNALVSRAWSEIALDTLWRQVDDLHRLFSLLAPLKKSSSGLHKFSRLPKSSDWTRFHRYSKRVRELIYDELKSKYKLSQSVFDDIARTRISFSILPNMHTLGWRAPIPICVMFFNSNIKNFSIHIPDLLEPASSHPLRPFFDDIAARMPTLASLDIQTNVPMNILEHDIIYLLTSLSHLHKLTLPRFSFTTRIAECVSKLPNLGCIEFSYSEDQGNGDPKDIAVFKPELSEGAFPALWDFSLTTTYEDLRRFLTIPFSSSSITTLYVESPNFETPFAIYQLLIAVSENCQMLKLLALISPRRFPEVDICEEEINATQRVKMDTLKPLLACAHLTSFEIIHRYPLLLNQEDVEILATRWSSLEILNLNSEPLYFKEPELTIEALLPFARHCHLLEGLGLFVDASAGLIPQSPSSSSSAFPVFSNLNRLSMGLSKITTAAPTAIFLSHLLPLTCTVESGLVWGESFFTQEDHLEIGDILKERDRLWGSVGFLVPTLVLVRKEERESVRRMVEDLRREERESVKRQIEELRREVRDLEGNLKKKKKVDLVGDEVSIKQVSSVSL